MNPSVEIARIGGIRIGINWSWLVVFALIVWSLTTAVFPNQNPGLSRATYVAMGAVAAILFFASLLAHELGHAFQARREGMVIEGITLWLFGGVARFKGMFPSAGAEFRIAVAGPAVSLAIGVVATLVAALIELPVVVDGVAAWLGYINLLLLVFNLLPALPLDGGRVLRSALWALRDDFRWATNVAASIGRGFGYVLISAGVAAAIFVDPVSGIWLAFIGWFLLGAAGAEASFLAAREAFGNYRVSDLMVREPAVVPSTMTIGEFMDEVVWTRRFTTYPVVESDRVVGLLPFRRVAEVPRGEWDGRRLGECMIPLDEVPRLAEDEPLVDALADLSESNIGRGLVLGPDDRVVGFLSITDLARVLEARGLRRRAR